MRALRLGEIGAPPLEIEKSVAACPPTGVRLPGVEQRLADCVAHDGDQVDPLGVDGVPDGLRVERPGCSTTRHPAQSHDMADPLAGGVHQRRDAQVGELEVGDVVGQLLGPGHRRHAHRVAAAEAGEERVLVAPQHALGLPRRATRVEEVVVVAAAFGHGRAGAEVATGGHVVVLGARRKRGRLVGLRSRHLHGQSAVRRRSRSRVAEARDDGARAHDRRRAPPRPASSKQVAELGRRVAVVGVERQRPDLPGADHRLQPLGAVRGEDRHGVARPDPPLDEVRGHAVRARSSSSGVGEAPVAAHHGLAVGHARRRELPGVGEVERGGRCGIGHGSDATLGTPIRM